MIEENIKNALGGEVIDVIDRDVEGNGIVSISATNINPCEIDLSFISRKYEECDGVYLMWLNNLGGWSSHLFFKAYERKLKTDNLGDVQRYYSNRAEASETFANLGVDAFVEWELENKIPYDNELHRKELESIYLSRQIYLYLGERFSGEQKWLLVKVKGGSHTTKENSIIYNELKVTLQLPKLNSLKL